MFIIFFSLINFQSTSLIAEESYLNEIEIEDLARYKLSLVGLSGYGDFYPSQLSGGMKKRAGKELRRRSG